MPVEQHTVDLHSPYPTIRLRAWIWLNTISQGHRWPWCVDEHGEPLLLEHAAGYFQWTLRYTRHVFAKLSAMGIAWEDEEKKLWLCGTVPQVPPPAEDATEDESRFDVESLPQYLKEQYQQLSPEQQDSLRINHPLHRLRISEMRQRRDEEFRADRDAMDDSFFGAYGMHLKRHTRRRSTQPPHPESDPPQDHQNDSASNQNHATSNAETIQRHMENHATSNSHPLYTKTEKTKVGRSVVSVIEEAPETGKEDLPADIVFAIPIGLSEKLGDTPSPALLQRIKAKLRGAPPAELTRKIQQRFDGITSFGILENFADDIGRNYESQKANNPPPAETPPLQVPTVVFSRDDRIQNLLLILITCGDSPPPPELLAAAAGEAEEARRLWAEECERERRAQQVAQEMARKKDTQWNW